MWQILLTPEFERWFETLDESGQDSILVSLGVLREYGPALSRPHVDTLKGSRHPNMKELRTQHRGQPFRTFFAFDPKRRAIVLIGGNKRGDHRFYDRMIPIADAIFDRYAKK